MLTKKMHNQNPNLKNYFGNFILTLPIFIKIFQTNALATSSLPYLMPSPLIYIKYKVML